MKPMLALLLLLAQAASAKVWFVNKGIKYHIGDDRFQLSTDKEFLDSHPVTGPQWIQAFRVSEDDQVIVKIDRIWGVDDCPYCKILVSIDDRLLGRIFAENNHQPFLTLPDLAFSAKKGRTHILKIESAGDQRLDDFAMEGLSVETVSAEVTFLKPGPILKRPEQPLPVFEAAPLPPPGEPCDALVPKAAWLPGLVLDGMKDELASGPLDRLRPGEAVEFFVRLEQVDAAADAVGRALELRLGGAGDSGWVLSFSPDARMMSQGNVRLKGEYRALKFPGDSYSPGAWNRLKVLRCADGAARLFMNNRDLGARLEPGSGELEFRMRARGLKLSVADRLP